MWIKNVPKRDYVQGCPPKQMLVLLLRFWEIQFLKNSSLLSRVSCVWNWIKGGAGFGVGLGWVGAEEEEGGRGGRRDSEGVTI